MFFCSSPRRTLGSSLASQYDLLIIGSNSIAHFNGGMYDVGFNSPPDFTGPMSNRSDLSENDKRFAVLQRQQSGIASPAQGNISVSNMHSLVFGTIRHCIIY